MPALKKNQRDLSTEEKIKEAARKLFTQKGFAETKTREIAEVAGINLALLNYYFRSKQMLYNLIMEENMVSFKQGIAELFGNTEMDVYQKIERLANFYIDEFIKNRDLPLFILSTINSKTNRALFEENEGLFESSRKLFFKQLIDVRSKNKAKPMHPVHIIANLMGLVIFPFVMSPMLKKRAALSDSEFMTLMNERKKLIPIWMKNILEN